MSKAFFGRTVLLVSVWVCSWAAGKEGYSLLTPDEARALKASMKGQVKIPDELADLSDEELWAYVPPATLRRAVFLGPTSVGCPAHGKEIFRVGGGFYPWKRSAQVPWKVQCPVGGEHYPSNDFGAYFKGGMREKPDTTKPYVDDGGGWVDAEGRRFFFVAYWVFWQRWYDVLKGIRAFTDAYFATDDETHAHKAVVLFCALAEQYPNMDYPKQGVQGCGGMILPWCWENQQVVTPLSTCYDRLFPYLRRDGSPALRAFLKTKTELGPRRQIEQRFMQTVAKVNFTTDMYWSNECDHQLALADLALAWDNNDPADGITTRRMIDWLINDGGDNSLEELLFNSTYRDGFPCEGAVGYSRSIAERQLRIAERLKRCGVDLFREFPRLRHVAGCWIDMSLEGGLCPAIGDSGSVLGHGRPWTPNTFHLAWENYGDPKFAQALSLMKSTRRTPYSPDRTEEFARVVEQHGKRLDQSTRNLGGMGLAILESGGPLHPRGVSLYYGCPAGGHAHHDRLNIEFFAHSRSMMPDLGYPDQWGRKRHDFTSNSIGHYSVLIDEQGEKNYMAGYLDFIKSFEHVQVVSAHAERCFPGAKLYRRTTALIDLSPEAGCVVDVFRVRGGRQHDWCFHLPPVPEWGLEGVALSGPQVKGTLAGEEVAEGAPVPEGRPNSGFNWLTNVQRGRPAGAYTFLSKAHAPYPPLRMTMASGCAQEVIVGDHESPRIKAPLPPTMKWLLARNVGAEDLSSVFAAVIEACPGGASVRGVTRFEASGGRAPLAMRIDTAAGDCIVFSDETGAAPAVVKEVGQFQARWATVRRDGRGISSVTLVSGARIMVADVGIVTQAACTGRITAVDFNRNTLDVDAALPSGAALQGEWMVISNDRHRTCYEVETVEALPRGSRIRLTEITPLVGKGYVDRIDEPERIIHTDTRWRIFGKDYIWSGDFGPALAGYALVNEDLSAAFEIEDCKLMPSRKRDWWKPEPAWIKLRGATPFEAAFRDADGDGRVGFRVYDFQPGCSFRITGSAELKRLGPASWSFAHTGGEALLTLPCETALDTALARGADGSVLRLSCRFAAQAKRVGVVVPAEAGGQVVIRLQELEGVDLTDREPPRAAAIRVDGKPVAPAGIGQLEVDRAPRLIEIDVEDDKNALAALGASAQSGFKTVLAGEDGVSLALAEGNPRRGLLRVEPGKIVTFQEQGTPTFYTLSVSFDDTAVDDARASLTFRFLLAPAAPEGTVHLSDLEPVKVFAHNGVKRDTDYLGDDVRLGGVPYRKSLMVCPERTDGPVNYGEAIYRIPAGKFKTFRAVLGIEDSTVAGNVIFSVQLRQGGGEWRTAYKSGPLAQGSPPCPVAVALDDADEIRLYTDANGTINCDHALFAGARLEP